MKRISLLLLSVFALSVANAQVKKSDQFDFSISDPYQVVDGQKIYFSKGGEVLAIKIVRGGYVFQKFSGAKLNESKRQKDEIIPDGFLLEGFNATFKVLCLDFNLHFLGFTLTVCFCSFEKKHFKLYERRISNLGR